MEYPRNELFASASNLKGAIVRNVRDEKLGEIEDLVLDSDSGQIVSVILLVNFGFMELENKYFVLPWEELHYDLSQEQEHAIILDMDKKELETSFEYSDNKNQEADNQENNWLLNASKIKNTTANVSLPKVNHYPPLQQRPSLWTLS